MCLSFFFITFLINTFLVRVDIFIIPPPPHPRSCFCSFCLSNSSGMSLSSVTPLTRPNNWKRLLLANRGPLMDCMLCKSMCVFVCGCVRVCVFSHVQLFATPWSPARLLCPRDFLGKITGMGGHFLLQVTFLTQKACVRIHIFNNK